MPGSHPSSLSLAHHYNNQINPSRPIGVAFFGAFFKFNNKSSKRTFHKALVLCITFIAYTCFHMGRRPLSIVKNVLNRNCTDVQHVVLFDESEDITYYEYDPALSLSNNQVPNFSPLSNNNNNLTFVNQETQPSSNTWCDWAPFNDDATANQLLALLDSAFLFSYAIFMFFSGFLADRCNLRYFLSIGMLLSGLLLYAFGLSFYFNIHSMTYFVLIQILSGAVQTTGWPSVVTCIGSWFDPSSRGAIFGLWNSNTNLGNILGATIAGYFVERKWGLSFIVPGFIMSGCGVLTFLFLVPRPEDVHLPPLKSTSTTTTTNCSGGGNTTVKQSNGHERDIEEAINESMTAATTPHGDYHQNHHRRKLQRNTSRHDFDSAVSETTNDDSSSNAGAIIISAPDGDNINGEDSPLIGGMSPSSSSLNLSTSSHHEHHHHYHHHQRHRVSFWTCLAIPGVVEYSLCLGFAKLVSYTFLYWLPRYITQSTLNNSEESAYLSVPFDVGGMFGAIVAGFLSDKFHKSGLICTVMLLLAIPSMIVYEKFASISNFYNICLQLITGTLVTGPYALITTAVSTDLGSRVKNGKAMATVAAIIDGTGSIGAAIGPLVAGYISDLGWQSVFMMLMVSDLIASLCLIRITLKELGFKAN